MLWQSSQLTKYKVEATDGSIGRVVDLLFDRTTWTLRWALIDTGAWLPDRKVLVPPAVFGQPDAAHRHFPVDVTREQVKNSRGAEADIPVSRQMENQLYGHYGWTPYWDMGPMVPVGPAPAFQPASAEDPAKEGDPHLHSIVDLVGYHVEARDGRVGQVQEFLVEEGSWIIRYAVIDAKTWWPGGLVLVAPQWITDISWTERRINVDQTRDRVKESPEFHPGELVSRDFEKRLFTYYAATPYWTM